MPRFPRPFAAAACFAALLSLGLAQGCALEHSIELPPPDGGPDGADEGINERLSTMPFLPEAGGSPEDFKALRTSILGLWWGATTYDERTSALYEVEFLDDGTFRTRCVTQVGCEPFGLGSEGDVGHRWRLVSLDEDGKGFGTLSVFLSGAEYDMRIQDVRYRSDSAVLTFVLEDVIVTRGSWGLAPVAGVALRRGSYVSPEKEKE